MKNEELYNVIKSLESILDKLESDNIIITNAGNEERLRELVEEALEVSLEEYNN